MKRIWVCEFAFDWCTNCGDYITNREYFETMDDAVDYFKKNWFTEWLPDGIRFSGDRCDNFFYKNGDVSPNEIEHFNEQPTVIRFECRGEYIGRVYSVEINSRTEF